MSIKVLSPINPGGYVLPTQDGLLGQILTTDGSGAVSFQNPAPTNNFYLTGLSFNTASGVLTATVSGSSDVTVNLDGRYALSTHTHSYDNYQSWNLRTNGVQRTTIQSGGILDLTAGSSISLAYSAGGVVTIASTDTLDSITGRGDTTTNSINAGGATFTGNVGIGTTSPSAKLHVVGTVLGQLFQSDTTNEETVTNTYTATKMVYRFSEGRGWGYNTADNAIYFANATDVPFIIRNGNVGIGTTSPAYKLEVEGSIGVKRIGVAATSTIDMQGNFNFDAKSGYSHVFKQAGSELARILPSGNVGIGTTSPSTKLELYGYNSSRNTLENLLTLNGGANSNNPYSGFGMGIKFSGRDYSNAVRDYAYIYGVMEDSNSSSTPAGDPGFESQLRFYTNTGGASATLPTQKMVITGPGNVGIGTTSPGAKLEVATGRIAVDSNFGFQLALTSDTQIGRWFNSSGINYLQGDSQRSWQIGSTTNGVNTYFDNVNNRVGIGTISPSDQLHINNDTSNSYATLRLEGANRGGIINFYNSSYPTNQILGDQSGNMYIATSGAFGSTTLSTKVTFATGGNVGIGTTSPGRKLTVQGADDGTMQLRLMGTASQTSYWDIGREAASTGQFRFIASRNGTVITPMVIDDQTGNVGIGTTSPSGALSVENTGTAGVPVLDIINTSVSQFNHSGEVMTPNMTTGQNNIFVIGKESTTKQSGYIGYKWSSAGSNANVLTFGHWGSDNLMNIDGLGNVGIGTTSPTNKLDIRQSTSSGSDVVGVGAISIGSDNPYWTFRGTATSLQDLAFDRSYAGTWYESMRIQRSTGNVGIGTTSPSYKLDVVGDVGINGTLAREGSGNNITYKWRTPSSSSWTGGTKGAKFGRFYWTPGHWVNTGPVIKVTIQSKYYTGVQRTYMLQAGYQDDQIIVNQLEVNDIENKTALLVGAKTSAGYDYAGQPVYYVDLSMAFASYMWGWAIVESQVPFLTANPTTTWGGVVMDATLTQPDTAITFPANYPTFLAGNVGIGTTTPSTKLQVAGIIQINESGETAFYEGNGVRVFGTQNYRFRNVGGGTRAIIDVNSTGVTAGNLTLYNASNVVTTKLNNAGDSYFNGGNVGIGTTSPNGKFTTVGTYATVTHSLAANDAISISSMGVNTGNFNAFTIGQANSLNNSAVMRFKYNGANSTSNYAGFGFYANDDILNIKADGNVGIGTSSPNQQLELMGNNAYTSKTRFSYGVGATNYFADWGYNSGGNKVYLTITDGGVAKDVIVANYNGNVGIGTASPLSQLSIGSNAITTKKPTVIIADEVAGGSLVIRGLSPILSFDRTGASPENKILMDGVGLEFKTGTLDAEGDVDFKIKLDGKLQAPAYTQGFLQSDANGNIEISGGGTLPGGPYLPLAAGAGSKLTSDLYIDTTIRDTNAEIVIRRSSNIIRLGSGSVSDVINAYSGGQIALTLNAAQNATFSGAVDIVGVLTADGGLNLNDNDKIKLGTSGDLQIYHDGSNSYINESGTGVLSIQSDGTEVQINKGASEYIARFITDAGVKLYYDNSQKFETTGTGVTVTGAATATTFLGDLNGTINTVTTAVTKANSTNDTTVATTAFVQNLIGTIPAGLVFQGTWNAATNTPTLTSGTGTTGNFYIVSVDGSTNLDGITDWKVGDWAVFVEQGASDQWEKVDNSSVLDGSGTGGRVTKWSGSGTSNTLTDSGISDASNAIAITINGNEEVGIGGSPFHKLDVYGTLRVSGQVTFQDDLSVNDSARFEGTTNPITIGDGFGYGGSATICKHNTDIYLQYNNGQTATNVRFGGGGTSVNLVDSQSNNYNISGTGYSWFNGGNVGIGTTSPNEKLHVNGGATNVVANFESTDAKVYISFKDNTTTNTDTVFLGAEGNNMTFYVGSASSERMRIDSSGNVGIGTTAPGYKLEVQGDFYTNGTNGALTTASSQSNLYLLNLTRTSTSLITAGSVGIGTTSPAQKLDVVGKMKISDDIILAQTNGRIDYDNGVSSGALRFFSTSGNSERMRITSGGNVGIGTTSPSSNLEVVGDAYIYDSSVTASGLRIDTGTANLVKLRVGYPGAWVNADVQIQSSTASGLDAGIYLKAGGNVGIGTTSPSHKLHVAADRILVENITNAGIMFRTASVDRYSVASTGGDFQIYDEVNLSNRLFITSTGNVGLNNNSPSQVLHVTGNARVTGAIYDSTNSAGTSGQVLSSTVTGTQWIAAGLGTIGGSGTTNYVSKFTGGTTLGNSLIYDNGTNVGIGTTTLQNSSGYRTLSISGSTGGQIAFQTAGTGKHYIFSSATDFNIYNSTAGNLILHTNAAERMRIDAAGNVGIRTNAPSAYLHLKGGMSYGSFRISPSIANGESAMAFFTDVAGTTTANAWVIGHAGWGHTGDFVIGNQANGGPVMLMQQNGNVGIGTTSPGAKLDVEGDVFINSNYTGSNVAANDLTIGKTTTGNHGITIATGTTYEGSIYFGDSDNNDAGIIGYQHSTNSMKFTTNRSERMRITSTGNVGIGTASPGEKLQVNSGNIKIEGGATSSIRGLIIAHTGQTGNQTLLVQNSTSSFGHLYTTERALRIEAGKDGGTGTGETLDFWVNGSERMMIDTTGNVGIGATSPGYKLSVNGDIHIPQNEYIYFDNTAHYIRRGASNVEIQGYNGLDLRTNGSTRLFIQQAGNVGIGTTAPAAKLDVEGDINIINANISNQEGTIPIGTTTVASVSSTTYSSMAIDYVVKNGLNLRSGTIIACHDGTNTVYTETSTPDIGSTTDITFAVAVSGADFKLEATVLLAGWTVKTLVRAL